MKPQSTRRPIEGLGIVHRCDCGAGSDDRRPDGRQLGAHATREQVRVARALRGLPLIRGEFGAGRLSYAKVRALTRDQRILV